MKGWVSGRWPFIIRETHRKYGKQSGFTRERETNHLSNPVALGDIVRISPNELSFIDPAAIQNVYNAGKGAARFVKPKFYDTGANYLGLPQVQDPQEHAKQRKLLSPAFSAKSLRDQEDIIHTYIDMFLKQLERLGDPQGPGVDMTEALNWVTFDIIGDLAFGESFGAVENAKTHFWVSLILNSTYLSLLNGVRKRFPLLTLALPFVLPANAFEAKKKHFEFSQAKMQKRIAMGDQLQRRDFLSHYLKEPDVPEGQLTAQASSLIIAGSETSTTLLAGLTYFLLRNTSTLAKLTLEIRGKFSSLDQITGDSLSNLPYLNAAIHEGLRLLPPLAFGLPRQSSGGVVAGEYIPKGIVVGVDNWIVFRDPRNFDDPDSFRPERWVEKGGISERGREAFQPFQVGPHTCIGINLAYLEMRIILAKIVWMYDWELVNKDLKFFEEAKLYLLWKKPPVVVRFHERGTFYKR